MKMNLKTKILLLVFCVAMVCPIVAGIIISRNNSTIEQFKTITEESLPKTRQMGIVLSGFRQLRIEVRSLAIRGNTPKDIDHYLQNIQNTMANLLNEKKLLIEMLSKNPEEKKMSKRMESAWKNFEALGTEILSLQKKGDEESLSKIADLVRVMCPKLASEFDTSVTDMVEWQKVLALKQSETAISESKTTAYLSVGLAILGVIFALVGGGLFATSLVKKISTSIEQLAMSASEISGKSDAMEQISNNLSEASAQQAASLQESVSSIDEISAMVSRNSDSALTSTRTSEKSTIVAREGKEKVGLMISSIKAIESGNRDIMEQVQQSNKEISEIVTVIQEIAQKTQVINDIVFQTKLLSFNASVEAARAGEHGKGFAVVAEEVGNLASMSGKAATEITDMLSKSVGRVTQIIDGTKSKMEGLMKQNTEKVETGTSMANHCASSLDEILVNVSSVNELLKEISSASMEQTSGITEVNKAMSELDQVTQQNSSAAQESSQTANELNVQVDRLNLIVSELTSFVDGKIEATKENSRSAQRNVPKNVVQISSHKRGQGKKHDAQLSDLRPLENDSRFEEA